jgi:NADH dehydrogenase/NADH:ubiquinone oxidoreductase subunit G
MSEVALIIDGRSVTVEHGTTVLEAARRAGVDIPTLCHVEGVAPFGACRLCTVEITRGGRSRLVASCCYPAEEGLDVQTESEKVVKGRKLVLEMLLARAPGTQALQEYGKRYGAQVDKFRPDPSHCILCGLCVNYCAEVKGKHAIGFIGRGVERQVMFVPGAAAEECFECGACFTLCPTGVWPSNYGLARVPHFS